MAEKLHAVVTGAGTGIGAVIASRLVAEGMRVTLMGRREDVLAACATSINNPAATQVVCCDVSDPESVTAAFSAAVAGMGPIEVLVNNAGAAPTAPFHKLTIDDWNRVIGVNLNGVFLCTSAVLGSMRSARSGRIINIASTAALTGYAYVSAYCAAKHAVLGLTRSLALETASLGITVNAICPGYTDTEIIRDAISNIVAKTDRSPEQALEEFTQVNPQGRLIDPAEIANTVLWLCSNMSASITGQAISVSGGEVM